MEAQDYADIHAKHVFKMLDYLGTNDIREWKNAGIQVNHLVSRLKKSKFFKPRKGKVVYLTSEFSANDEKAKQFLLAKFENRNG